MPQILALCFFVFRFGVRCSLFLLRFLALAYISLVRAYSEWFLLGGGVFPPSARSVSKGMRGQLVK